MTIYIVVVVISFLLVSNIKQKKIIFYTELILLFLLSSFRASHIGTDYKNYIHYFQVISNGGSVYFSEKGYVLFNKFLASISNKYYTLAIGVNLMIFIPLCVYLKKVLKDNRYIMVAVLIFALNPYMWMQTTFNAMRQCCATGIILIGCLFLNEKRYWYYFFSILIAFQFHRIALVMLILPAFQLINWNKKRWNIVAVISLLLSSISSSSIITRISTILGFGGYATYENSLLDNPLYIIFVFAYILLLIRVYDFSDDNKFRLRLVNLYLLSLCLLLFGVKNDMVYRARMMLAYVTLPAIPMLFSFIDELFISNTNIVLARFSKLFKYMHIMYYVCFFIGYITLLFYNKNIDYVPFCFANI